MDITDRGALDGLRLIVVGAGAAGLSVAFEAARRGADTIVLDAGQAGRGALWAAAGMITPSFEVVDSTKAHPRLHELAFRALAQWPSFAASVERISGLVIDLRLDGALAVGAAIRPDADSRQGGATPLTVAEARALEPALSQDAADLWFAEAEGQVDNKLLARALIGALENLGMRLIEHAPVIGLMDHGGRVTGVRAADGRHWEGDAVLWSVGATPRHARRHPVALQAAGTPVKGQILALRAACFAPSPPRRVIRGQGVYLAPKNDGRVVVGATMEAGVTDLNVDQATVDNLRDQAAVLVPSARRARISQMWAGVRPGSPDEAPFLGPVGLEGLYSVSGLHRSGVALAPVVADIMCGMLAGVKDSLADAFSATRFQPLREE